jgi:hypothetical protein
VCKDRLIWHIAYVPIRVSLHQCSTQSITNQTPQQSSCLKFILNCHNLIPAPLV